MSEKLSQAEEVSKFFGLIVIVTSGVSVAVGIPAVGLSSSVGAFVLAVILGVLLTITLLAACLYLVATHEIHILTRDEIVEEDEDEDPGNSDVD